MSVLKQSYIGIVGTVAKETEPINQVYQMLQTFPDFKHKTY